MLLSFGVELEFGDYYPNRGSQSKELQYYKSIGLIDMTYDSSIQLPAAYEWRLGIFQAALKEDGKFDYPIFASVINAVLEELKGARVNTSCGMHVHVSSMKDVSLSYEQRKEMLSKVHFWRCRRNYVDDNGRLEDHYSGIGIRDGMNHLEFRWPNGTLNKRGIHAQVQKVLKQYMTLLV